MSAIFNPKFQFLENSVNNFIQSFHSSGTLLVKGNRNTIRLFPVDTLTLNIKAFKVPHLLNQFIYKFVRPSKAKRSFDYATLLLQKGIGTPEPIAYIENFSAFGLSDSYYVSEHLNADLTFRELVEIPDFKNHEAILRAFTRFCFKMHEKGIEFLDHSPGNTLVKITPTEYEFYLVDLNRMKFHTEMNFDQRMKNLSRLTPKKEMVAVMANEYAKLYDRTEGEIFDKMWGETSAFQSKFHRKAAFKKSLKLSK